VTRSHGYVTERANSFDERVVLQEFAAAAGQGATVDEIRAQAERFTGRPDDFFIDPSGVAAIAADLVKQDRSAWSFEVEARPFKEKW